MVNMTKTIGPITLRRNGKRIELRAPSGAVVAYLRDGDDQITYDPLADTEEMLGEVNYYDVIKAAGLDVDTVRMIDSMPAPDNDERIG
jgi:hypothetical protein